MNFAVVHSLATSVAPLKRRVRYAGAVAVSVGLAVAGLFQPAAQATSDTWDGSDSALWSAVNNWLTNPASVPGTGETATFSLDSATVNARTTIDLGTGVTVGGLVFDTASAAAYTIGSGAIGSQTLTLNTASAGNAITVNAAVTTNQIINANILNNTADNTLRLVNNTSTTTGPTLTINGTIQGGTGTAARTVNATGNVTLNGAVTGGSATSVALANVSTGTLTLGGGTSTLSTLVASAAGKVIVNGATVGVSSLSTYGTGASTFELQSGTANFNGGLRTASSDSNLFKVSGGTFSASSVELRRTSAFTTLPTAASATTGFVVTGGTANITGVLTIGATDSSASTLVNGGSLTVGGEVRVGNNSNSTGRYNVLEVRSGSFTSTDAVNGIILSRGSTGGHSELLLTGGVTTTEKITFGISTTFTGALGYVVLNGANAELYVGSGGIVKAAVNPYTETINLTAGTLGAKANWSSSLNMNLNGTTGLTIKAADASNVARNIALTGNLTGTGGFTKTGDGIVSLGGTNDYLGATTVSAGTLLVNGSHTGGGNYTVTASGAKLGGAGSITGASASSITLGANSFLMAGKTHGTGAGADTTAQILTLTTGAGDINLNGTLQFDLFSSSGDQLDLNTGAGFLNLAGGKVELALGQDASTVLWGTSFTSWKLIDWANLTAFDTAGLALTSSTISTFQSLGYTLTQSIVDDGTANAGFYVNIALVPEPTRPVLLCLGLGMLIFTRRRSARAVNPCDAFVLQ